MALPYQVFVLTGSAFLTGLLGAAEIVPLAAGSLYGGALADRFDRRRMLLACQLALVAVAAAPLPRRRARRRRRSGSSSCSRARPPAPRRSSGWCARRSSPTRSRPNACARALSLTYGLYQLTQVVGPGRRRPADRRLRHRRALRGRRGQLPRHGRRRGGDVARSRRTRSPSTSRSLPLDPQRPALRARAEGADGRAS